MDRIRPVALVVYLMLTGGFLALILAPWPPQPPLTPKERWENFQQWLGKPPAKLSLREWSAIPDDEQSVVFITRAEEIPFRTLVTKLELVPADSTQEIPRALLPENTTAKTLYRMPQARLLCDNSYEWGYHIHELMLAELDQQQALLAILYRFEDENMNSAPCIEAWHDEAPRRKETSIRQAVLAVASVFSPFWIPLGMLLTIRRFDFRKRSHYLLWYGVTCLVPPMVYLTFILLTIPPSPTQAIALFTAFIFIMPVGIAVSAIVQLVARCVIRSNELPPEKN